MMIDFSKYNEKFMGADSIFISEKIVSIILAEIVDIQKVLEDTGEEASDDLVAYIAGNLYGEIISDNEFWDVLDRSVSWLKQRYSEEKRDGLKG